MTRMKRMLWSSLLLIQFAGISAIASAHDNAECKADPALQARNRTRFEPMMRAMEFILQSIELDPELQNVISGAKAKYHPNRVECWNPNSRVTSTQVAPDTMTLLSHPRSESPCSDPGSEYAGATILNDPNAASVWDFSSTASRGNSLVLSGTFLLDGSAGSPFIRYDRVGTSIDATLDFAAARRDLEASYREAICEFADLQSASEYPGSDWTWEGEAK